MWASPVDILPISSAQKRRFPAALFSAGVLILFAAEVAVFLGANRWLGWRLLVDVSLVTAVFGVVVIGLTIVRYAAVVAHRLDQDECLDDELSTGLLLLAAGVLLLLPGIITDFLGLALLLPATRRLILPRSTNAPRARVPSGRGLAVSACVGHRRAGPRPRGGRRSPADACLPGENAGRLSTEATAAIHADGDLSCATASQKQCR